MGNETNVVVVESAEAAKDAESTQAETQAEVKLESVIFTIDGEDVEINYTADSGKIADQEAACLSIIAYAALEARRQQIRKGLKNIEVPLSLGWIPEDQAHEIQRKATRDASDVDAKLNILVPIMERSHAFTVPQGGGTATPANVVSSPKDLRQAAVTGAHMRLRDIRNAKK